jgi:hypothetical protein
LGNDISENPGPFDNEISIFHLNIRSIRRKLDYVEALALGSSIVCITESHLDDTVLSRDIQIQGYHENILRKDRNCFGGGVLHFEDKKHLLYHSKNYYFLPINQYSDLP